VSIPQKRSLNGRIAGLTVALVVFGVLGALIISGFVEGRQEAIIEAEREKPIKPPLRVALRAFGQPLVTVDTKAQKAIGLLTLAPPAAPYQDQIRAFGTVLDMAGLTKLYTDYVAAISRLKTAQAKLAASLPAFKRAKSLRAKNIGSLAGVQAKEAALIGDRAAVAAARSTVRTLVASAVQEWGQVIGKGIVNSAPLVSQLIERREFLLQITLPPGLSIDPPPVASVEPGNGSHRIEANYISPATRTDPKIQGLSFFYATSSDSGLLPGMNVRAFLASGAPLDGYVIPPSAVVWWSGRAWVYIKLEDNVFTRREIRTDMPTGREGEVVMPAGTLSKTQPVIVVKGAQMLLSEESRAQIQVEGDDD